MATRRTEEKNFKKRVFVNASRAGNDTVIDPNLIDIALKGIREEATRLILAEVGVPG